MSPGLCFFRNGSSCPVSGRTARSFSTTTPATLPRPSIGTSRVRGVPVARQTIAEVESFDGVREIAHEVAAANFAVGKNLESKLLLFGEHAQNRGVLDFPQPLRVSGFSRLEQFGRAEETSDVIGAVGRLSSFFRRVGLCCWHKSSNLYSGQAFSLLASTLSRKSFLALSSKIVFLSAALSQSKPSM